MKLPLNLTSVFEGQSRPARGARIEIDNIVAETAAAVVAPRTGRED